MAITRRAVLAGLGMMAAMPRLVRAEITDDGFQVLRAQVVENGLLEADTPKTSQWHFSTDPITVIQARQGVELKIRIINQLTEEIWLHWFGVRGPSEQMTVNVPPGEAHAVDCIFTPPDAGTFWFGPFIPASKQREMGLYGLLLVGEGNPLIELYDVPMIVDDWRIDNSAKIIDDFGDLQTTISEGRMGNWFTVNDKYRPHLSLPADAVCRLRLLNAANARAMSLQFKGGDPLLIALDGQPIVPRHAGDDLLALQPGQRMDLLIDVGVENIQVALDLFEDLVEICYLDRKGTAVETSLPENFALPANPISNKPELEAAETVVLTLTGGAKGGLTQAYYNNELLPLRQLLEKGKGWAINGVAGPGGAPVGKFERGKTVIFEIINNTIFAQPLHLHGHVWQVIEDDSVVKEGEPWRDTTVVKPQKRQKLVFIADNPGSWAVQSLVAERVDAGLLAGFEVL